MRWVRVATLLLVILFDVPSPPHLGFAQPQPRDILVSPTTGEGVGSIWGVFIGVSQYKHKELDLQFADQDAEALFQFFSNQFLGKVPADHFTLLKNEDAQRGPILRALNEVLRRSQPEDLVIISMAMHGLLDPTGQDLYFMTHDADQNFPEDDGISRDDVLKQIRKSKARKIVLLLDACHTGAFGSASSFLAMRSAETAGINRLLIAMGQAQDGLAVLSSSSAAERSREGEIFCGGHGAFTCALLTGLQGEADTNRNGLVEVRELYDFTYRTVKTSTDGYQNPAIDGNYDNGLPLAYVGDQGIGEARTSLGPGTPSDHTSEELSLVLQELKALKEQLGYRPAQKTEPNGNATAEELARLREEVRILKERMQEPRQEKPTRPKGEGKPPWSPDTKLARSQIQVRNSSVYLGKERYGGKSGWEWTIYVIGDKRILDDIRCVTYTLHPTFPDPIRKVCRKGNTEKAFSHTTKGWGTFTVEVLISFKDGEAVSTKHQLVFRK